MIFLRSDIFWITDKRVGQGMGQGANGGLTRSLFRPSADASFSRKNMKILKIKLSGDILVLE